MTWFREAARSVPDTLKHVGAAMSQLLSGCGDMHHRVVEVIRPGIMLLHPNRQIPRCEAAPLEVLFE